MKCRVRVVAFCLTGALTLGFSWGDTEKKDLESAAAVERDTAVPDISGVAVAAQSGYVPSQVPVASSDTSPLRELEIIKIQKQISNIVAANEKFRSLHRAQTEQLHQITEQSRMHKRMLRELEEKSKNSRDLTASDVDEILRQEKMRIIEDEAGKNRETLDQISANN